MTNFTHLSDKELSEAISFHRRQRNLSRGMNEAHHMRQTQMVRMLEAEEARRLDEASEIHDKVHDIASLQKHFGAQVAGDAANHSPAMMIRKANDGKKYHLVNTDKGYHAKLAEEVELDEETMPGNVALRLVDRHQAAAFHHKKNGNMKGYAAHWKVANAIEDAVIRTGRYMPIRSKRHEAASDKALREYPHRIAQKEEVELDEVSKKILNRYVQKATDDYQHSNDVRKDAESRGDKALAAKMQDRMKKRNKGMSRAFGEEVELGEASNKLVGRYMNKFGGNVLYVEIYEKPNGNYVYTISNQRGVNMSASYIDLKSSHADAKKNVDRVTMYYDQDGDNGALRFLNGFFSGWKKAPLNEEVELGEASNLRVTKVYNKFPKKATYAVHNADRSYHKEFDSMEAAQAHKAEKSK